MGKFDDPLKVTVVEKAPDEKELEDDREILDDNVSDICSLCARLIDSMKRTCDAFPKGIPSEIWDGKNNHTSPVKGDDGVLFEPLTPKTAKQLIDTSRQRRKRVFDND